MINVTGVIIKVACSNAHLGKQTQSQAKSFVDMSKICECFFADIAFFNMGNIDILNGSQNFSAYHLSYYHIKYNHE